jgi:tripartite-type tricarboxylate transporter receptor subunit TctC
MRERAGMNRYPAVTAIAAGFAAVLCTIVALVAPARADEPWPAKPVSMVVPFPPGGVADIVGRPVADAMSRTLNVPVIIENKPGAGGGIGMGYVAKSKPDGYTILLALSSISILPEADKVIGRAPMYQLKEFVPIARFTADPTVLAVRTDSPWKTLAEFVADARKRPGAISYGSSGNYGTMHVPMEMFAGTAGIKLLHVPYTGAGPAVVALLGGNIDAVASGPSTVIQHVKAGKLRVLASWGDKRLTSMPDVPTLSESGYPVVFFQWSALFAPAGTPAPVLTKLRDAAHAAALDPKFVAAMATVETPVQYLDAPDLARFWDADSQKLGDAVHAIGKVE